MKMSLLEGIHQYQTNTASNTQNLESVKETAAIRPTAQAQELLPGKVFEGMVTEMKNGQVTLGLSDGRTISARMETGVALEKGQPMLFQVKSNTGDQIAIRPVTLESAQNPTLLKALEAAGLKVNPRNLSMVNQMMMEQLPIDKSSLMQMARAVMNFPQAEMQTLVQMQKLGIRITEESLNQFQNYKNGQQAILPEMQNLMEGITNLPEQLFGKEGIGQNNGFLENFTLSKGQELGNLQAGQDAKVGQLLEVQQQILDILLEDSSQITSQEQVEGQQNSTSFNQTIQNQTAENIVNTEHAKDIMFAQDSVTGTIEGGKEQFLEIINNNEKNSLIEQDLTSKSGEVAAGKEGVQPEVIENLEKEAVQDTQNPIDKILTREQQGNLTNLLREFSGAINEKLLPEGRLNTNLSAGELLQQIMGAVENSEHVDSSVLKKLFSSDEYKGLMKQAMTEQWMLTPEKLKEEGAVKELYQRLTRQMTELQQVLSQTGKEGSALAKTAQSVQSNLDFMNQLNQVYTYVQLPLKLRQQNAHSDLYVYTNKKNLREKEGNLSALLHLDMEYLGSTDIYVKMQGASVQTDFYMTDILSCQLIANFAKELVERLEQKGYNCEIKVENRQKQQDVVQEFLEQESSTGKLHRYSFDVKA